ncbi:sulfatase [Burkholderiaceae bacterium 16]|nr:sulfatase [Burkholderiaceae bacterium 16]
MKRRALISGLLASGVAGAAGLLSAKYFRGFSSAGQFKGPVIGDGVTGPRGMVWVPGGTFLMGSSSERALPSEGPAHRVQVSGFWMDSFDVTNADFRRFTEATRYVTTSEQKPRWEDIRPQLPPGTPEPDPGTLVPGSMVFVGTSEPVELGDWSRWWRYVPGANWRHPLGPQSNLADKENHPVVQVSYVDALNYARWAGKRLPTEVQWEFAARGGLEQADYAWGDELAPNGKKMANTWDDRARQFPVVGRNEKIQVGTLPVGNFAPNGYGIYDMAGNVWQWTADWYRSDAFAIEARKGQVSDPQGPVDSYDPDDAGAPVDAPKRVIRGGSFLCSETYCTSYRVSARRGSDPFSAMSHLGFRTIMTQQDWLARKSSTD